MARISLIEEPTEAGPIADTKPARAFLRRYAAAFSLSLVPSAPLPSADTASMLLRVFSWPCDRPWLARVLLDRRRIIASLKREHIGGKVIDLIGFNGKAHHAREIM